MLVGIGLVDGPDDDGHEEEDIDNLTRVERHAERIDKEQLKPSAYRDDAGHHAVEHGGHDDKRYGQRGQRSLGLHIGEFLIDEHQYDGRNAEQIQQVDTDAQAGHIGDQHQPTVAVRLVGMILPLQDEPEHHGCERRGVGIHLALDSRKPEGVAERIDQRAHESRCFDGDEFAQGERIPIFQHQFACEVGDAPEEKQDRRGTQQCTHDVHHARHL